MQRIGGRFVYAASDLNNESQCEHLTFLEREVALQRLKRPPVEAAAELIASKGSLHEANYLARLQAQHGDDLAALPERSDNTLAGMQEAEAQTLAAMARGVRIIYQASFFDGTFLGRADFLRRVERPSQHWAWSYEVIDTKLALGAKPYFLIQLCNYSEHVARLQGTQPGFAYIVLGSGAEQRFRLEEYAAYYRRLKALFLERIAGDVATYPSECGHCAICRWSDVCEQRREDDDYLGLVAWMREDQIAALATRGITTIAQLGAASEAERPQGMREATFETLRAQAALQHRQRQANRENAPGTQRHFYELLPYSAEVGLTQLFEPAPGDVFFDMEGDPLYAPGRGLEYLFGLYLADEDAFVPFWALDGTQERAAFERCIDFITERRKRYPNLHVYHYAPYETTALRRLMGRYGTREDALDNLLRNKVFVDLYGVVRQSVRISQPSYSIKKLEPFYGMRRSAELKKGDDSIVQFETWLATKDDTLLRDIATYNEEDCRSTYLLLRWLLERRAELEAGCGTKIPWRELRVPAATDLEDDRGEPARALLEGLDAFATVEDLRAAVPDVRARWLLGHLLQYHRREAKPAFWRIIDRCEHPELLEEHDTESIGGLRICVDEPPYKLRPSDRNQVFTYTFPRQQHKLGNSPPLSPYHGGPFGKTVGEIVHLNDEEGILRIKVSGGIVPSEIRALIPSGPIATKGQRSALVRIAEAYLAGELARTHPATLDILLARSPRLRGRLPGLPLQPASVTAEAISELVAALDGSYLFIQGPPGTGKSTKGASVVVDLLAAGKRVAIMSGGHKAIANLLGKIEEKAAERGVSFRGLYKRSQDETATRSGQIEWVDSPRAFQSDHQLAAGTSWLFCRDDLTATYDYLFIDEAGQTSLADALACAPAAHNIVLLGDPLQLAQVAQGSHPIGTGASVLEHVLGDDITVRGDRGIFLDVCYRMHPSICTFVSEMVYENRLTSDARTHAHAVESVDLRGSGLRLLQVDHSGNSSESEEEAHALVGAVLPLLDGTVAVEGKPPRPMTQHDILVVVPYNAHRKAIQSLFTAAGLGGIRVGTVDKFQGQEAPVVFYAMGTSSGDDMPRDMTFLFEQNRFNVAISRAQCLSILVCSPKLLDVGCTTVEHMVLANLLCRFAEVAADEVLLTQGRVG